MAAPEVSSTRLYLGNLPRDGTQIYLPRFTYIPWTLCVEDRVLPLRVQPTGSCRTQDA